MSIYHRTYTRIPLALNVQLQFKGQMIGQTQTRDINQFGAFIELPAPELATNDFVRVYFSNNDGDSADTACVEQKGMVMHCSKEGVGILFATDTEEFRSMLNQEISHIGANSRFSSST